MIQKFELFPGITLRCFADNRFKQGCLSFQIVRLQKQEEAAMNALIPTVLLRGCEGYPDLRSITNRLDELYGASVGTMVRRVGDYQTTGFYCGFIEDRFAMDGDEILEPMVQFLGQLLLKPLTEAGGFHHGYVNSEKKNLIATIEADLNDKRAYAMGKLLKNMCRADSFGVPRLGEKESVSAIDPVTLYNHYCRILRTSPIELFYVGSTPAERIAALLTEMLKPVERRCESLPGQTPFHDAESSHETEQMDVVQGKLCMGFTTPILNSSSEFAAMQMFNTVFGAGMTSKLFMQVREKLSLCYAIGSGYYGSKGILTVSAGIDCDKEEAVRSEVLAQLDACCRGDISDAELNSAREALLSSLRGVHDSPGAIESYYATAAISGADRTPALYMEQVRAVTAEDVAAAARTVKLHSTYFLKGVEG